MKDPEDLTPSPNEAVADLHKALKKELEGERGRGYGSTEQRARSFHHTERENEEAAKLKAPGGFRRGFLNEQAQARGVSPKNRPREWRKSLVGRVRPLIRAGQFDSVMGIRMDPQTGQELPAAEGNSGLTPTALALVKSFVGSGITFMPMAFSQGGWLFSSIVLAAIAFLNGVCISRIVHCQDLQANPRASFADIAQVACGWLGKFAVQVSLVISQFGVCIAYLIFISQLVQSVGDLSHALITCILFPVIVPLCLIRSVDNLEYPNLIADALILFGLVVVVVYGCYTMATTNAIDNLVASVRMDNDKWRLLAETNYQRVVLFKPDTCGIFIGMAIFTFEGVPMVLPIRNSMAKRDRFMPLFAWVFSGIALFFLAFGLIGYISYKEKVETVVLLNLPPTSRLTLTVKFGYMLALCFSTPLMFLPAARITELWVFGTSETREAKDEDRVWLINAMRTFEILAFCLVAALCAPYFDRFLAIIGALCCAPVAFVYPSLFHLVLCAKSTTDKAVDVALLVFGICAMVFTFVSTVCVSSEEGM